MNEEQLRQLRTAVEGSNDLPEEAKAKLLALVANAQEDAAEKTAEPTATMGKLMDSVAELEAAHPEATAFMNRVATALGNMGI